MELDKLKSLAGGRVWTGVQAKENGLVDVLGTLEDAVDLAAKRVGIEDDYQVKYYPTPKSDFELLVERISEESKIDLKEKLGILAPLAEEVNELTRMEKLQARMPYEITFE